MDWLCLCTTLHHVLRLRRLWAISAVWTALTIGLFYRTDNVLTKIDTGADQPSCTLATPEVLSAIKRSQTVICKNELAAFGCLLQQDGVFPNSLPNLCPENLEGDPFVALDIHKPSRKTKILFALTVYGRDSRQVNRLLNLIYQPEHFYVIHVDKRSTFLFQDLLSLEENFQNVVLMRERRSPIWGGASLLTVLLEAMKFGTDRWTTWDYFINLSESDLPIRPIEDLVQFLGENYGHNFAKSHGQSVQQFIKRQGLDRTFYECENRMWLVERKRRMPQGIEMDGGSDWVALHRSFCSYLVSEPKDDLLNGLLVFHNHTLLPAESFFHIVLHNSEFCHTFTNNNLRLTNWNRKKGCYCQYRHIVDWCGCSPNAFRMDNLNKITAAIEKKSVFFARKFDPFVSLVVIDKVIQLTQNNPPLSASSTPHKQTIQSVKKHWLNLYTSTEKNFSSEEAETLFKSLHQISFNSLKTHSSLFDWKKSLLLSVHVSVDHHLTSRVLLSQQIVKNGRKKVIETAFDFVNHFSKRLPNKRNNITENITNRFRDFAVSSDFDQKEDIFRNYHRALGVQSDLVGRFDVDEGQEALLSVVWIDPADIVAGSFELNLTEEAQVLFQPPTFEKPLRPGEWTAYITLDWQVIIHTKFLVLPSLSLTDNHGPKDNVYIDFNFTSVAKILSLRPDKKAAAAEANVAKSGREWEKWVDELVGKFYMTDKESLCEVEKLSFVEKKSGIKYCEEIPWSSYFSEG